MILVIKTTSENIQVGSDGRDYGRWGLKLGPNDDDGPSTATLQMNKHIPTIIGNIFFVR